MFSMYTLDSKNSRKWLLVYQKNDNKLSQKIIHKNRLMFNTHHKIFFFLSFVIIKINTFELLKNNSKMIPVKAKRIPKTRRFLCSKCPLQSLYLQHFDVNM